MPHERGLYQQALELFEETTEGPLLKLHCPGVTCVEAFRRERVPFVSDLFQPKLHVDKSLAATLPLILLAEDHPGDVFLMRFALGKAAIPNPLVVASDGQEAIDYLAGDGPYANRKTYPLPDLFLLDLKMPRLNGFDVLTWLKDRPEFDELPIVVLSSSDIEEDIQRAKELGADDYRVKPSGNEKLVKLLQELHARWLQ